MIWSELEPDISHIPLASFCENSGLDYQVLAGMDSPVIVFSLAVREKVKAHLSEKKVELGGLLLGSVISSNGLSDGIRMVIVKDAIKSEEFDATPVSLSMSPAVWMKASNCSDTETFVVGWYHSHPNIGAFFSATDRKTQREFFFNQYSVGLVIDPIRNEEKWYMGRDAMEIKLEHVFDDYTAFSLPDLLPEKQSLLLADDDQ